MDASEILSAARIVPVVVIEDVATAVPLARTLGEAGLAHIEVTLRTDAALAAIERIAADVPELTVGAGSVRSPQQMADIINAGAVFAVSPGCSTALLDAARDFKVPFVPGAVTPSESMQLLDAGYVLQKFFPAELSGGRAFLSAMNAPLPEPRFFPTGGITPENASSYLLLSNVACIGGTWIAPAALLAQQDFNEVSRRARDAVALTL